VRRAPTAGWDAFTSLTCERVLGRNVSPYISFAGALFEWSFVRRTKQGGGEEGGESFVSMGSRGGMIEMRLLTPYLSPPYLFVWLVVLVKREKVAVHFPLLLLFPPLHLSLLQSASRKPCHGLLKPAQQRRARYALHRRVRRSPSPSSSTINKSHVLRLPRLDRNCHSLLQL
jgi:hypothetical protein